MRSIIDRWTAEDLEATWQWAERLVEPVAREFAGVVSF